ncbi:DUF3558 family protein (plasmid) [Lentzea sp. JNUCC 0626]|uniref:DUF3558 family protein n=1 Tax=Lentzea sp. JNUCC 0626 TaxID=3367513 RepID=UPI003747D92B
MITARLLSTAVATAAIGLSVIACSSPATETASGKAAPAGSTSAASTTASGPAQADPSTGAKPTTSNGSGAFDPCEVGWSAFPAAVRPADSNAKPVRVTAKGSEPYDAACQYDNSGPDARDPQGKHFLVTIFRAAPGRMSADPAAEANRDAKPGATTFGGRTGILREGKNRTSGEPNCGALVSLPGGGVGGVLATNGEFPDVDPCAVARGLAETIAAKP